MFKEFREIVKNEGLRGWRLEKEEEEFYFSKFDDRFNDDEFRFFLQVSENTIHIKRMQKIKSYKKIMNVSPTHEYTKVAESLCQKLMKINEKAHV